MSWQKLKAISITHVLLWKSSCAMMQTSELWGYFKKHILINCSNIYKQDNLSFPEGTTYKKENRNFMENPYTS